MLVRFRSQAADNKVSTTLRVFNSDGIFVAQSFGHFVAQSLSLLKRDGGSITRNMHGISTRGIRSDRRPQF